MVVVSRAWDEVRQVSCSESSSQMCLARCSTRKEPWSFLAFFWWTVHQSRLFGYPSGSSATPCARGIHSTSASWSPCCLWQCSHLLNKLNASAILKNNQRNVNLQPARVVLAAHKLWKWCASQAAREQWKQCHIWVRMLTGGAGVALPPSLSTEQLWICQHLTCSMACPVTVTPPS